jgi:serine/threonine-protein kinase
VLHRDLKPGNVMLGQYGETLVVDWGLAKALGRADGASAAGPGPLQPASRSGSAATQAGTALGTPAYMSPEQAAGRLDRLGPASDVYGLGATLYCLLAGRAPFAGASAGEVLSAVQKGEFTPPRQAEPGVPAALEAVCLKAMALRPEDRYASAQALAQDVERWLADEPVSAWREPLRVRAGRWVRRHQMAVTATAAAAIVALLLGGGGAFLFERQRAQQEARLVEGVETALEEVTKLEGKGRLGEARAVLDQAASRLGEDGPQDLRARVEQARQDLNLVALLDDIRLRRAAVVEGQRGFDFAGTDRRYAAAFAEAGLAREGEDPADAAVRIRATAVRDPLVAALDDWAYCAQEASRRAWLLAVARMADPDRWRDRARQPALWRDRNALQELLADEESPDQSPQLLDALGNSLSQRGGDAVGVQRRALMRHPDDFWLNFNLGLRLLDADPAEAAGYYRATLALRPGMSSVRNNLGVALHNQQRWQEAEAEYRAAIRLGPKDASPHYHLGILLWERGKLQEAEAEYRAAIRLGPKYAPRHNELGKALSKQGKPQEAEAEYRTAIRLDPKYATPHYHLGILLWERGKLQEAEAEYRAAIRLDPKYAAPHNGLGNVLKDQGRPQEAEAEYRAAVRLDPKLVEAHNGLGNVLKNQGRPQEAEAEYRAAIQIDPKLVIPHYNLGNLLREQGKLKEAEAEYRAAIRLDPKGALAHNNLGDLLRAKGKPQEAEAECRAAIRLDPKLASAHSNLSVLLHDQGKRQEAEAEYRAAIRLDPKEALYHECLGFILREQDRLKEAEEEFRTAISLNPKVATSHAKLGHVLKYRGRFEEARKEYQQAVDLGLRDCAVLVRQCNRLIPLAPRLPAVLRGEDRPADAQEMLGFGEVCAMPFERRPRAAARFYGDAFAADPKLADDLETVARYNAACCAALAGCGQGKDADTLGAQEKARLRRQALDWLRADLAAWAKQAQSHQPADRAGIQYWLQHWKEDADLAGVRGDALARLPEAERPPWKKLWEEVDALLGTVSAPETKR